MKMNDRKSFSQISLLYKKNLMTENLDLSQYKEMY